jgi:hypothetical protein
MLRAKTSKSFVSYILEWCQVSPPDTLETVLTSLLTLDLPQYRILDLFKEHFYVNNRNTNINLPLFVSKIIIQPSCWSYSST